jgi:hypothetical protein
MVPHGATGGDALLDVCLVRPESLANSCTIEQEISDHCGVLLEVTSNWRPSLPSAIRGRAMPW